MPDSPTETEALVTKSVMVKMSGRLKGLILDWINMRAKKTGRKMTLSEFIREASAEKLARDEGLIE